MLVATNPFLRFYTFLAKMGLVMLDDPPKVIDLTGREWGDAVDGLRLSIRELPREDSEHIAGVSVVMKNEGASAKALTVPAWIHYFEVAGLELSPYGLQLMNPARTVRTSEVTLAPGDAIETDLPIARIYRIPAGGEYRIQISCRLPDQSVLRSNTIGIRA